MSRDESNGPGRCSGRPRREWIAAVPLAWLAACGPAVLYGSGGDSGSSSSDPPKLRVVSVVPADGASKVDNALEEVTVTFNRDVKESTVNDATVLLLRGQDPVQLAGLEPDGPVVTLRVRPAGSDLRLTLSATYEVRVEKAVKGAGGARMEEDWSSTFGTRDGQWGQLGPVPGLDIDERLWGLSSSQGDGLRAVSVKTRATAQWADTIQVFDLPLDDDWSPGDELASSSPADRIQLDVHPSGHGVLTFTDPETDPDRVLAAVSGAGNAGWSPLEELTMGYWNPIADVHAGLALHAICREYSFASGLDAAIHDVTLGVWLPVRRLDSGLTYTVASDPTIGTLGSLVPGVLFFLWIEEDLMGPGYPTQIWYTTFSQQSGWSPDAKPLRLSGSEVRSASIVRAGAKALVVWIEEDEVLGAFLPPTTDLPPIDDGDPFQLDVGADVVSGTADDLSVAEKGGTIVVAWTSEQTSFPGVRTAFASVQRAAPGPWTAEAVALEAGVSGIYRSLNVDVAIDDYGNAWLAWDQLWPAGGNERRVAVQPWFRDGGWGTARLPPGSTSWVREPQIAILTDGRATLTVWEAVWDTNSYCILE